MRYFFAPDSETTCRILTEHGLTPTPEHTNAWVEIDLRGQGAIHIDMPYNTAVWSGHGHQFCSNTTGHTKVFPESFNDNYGGNACPVCGEEFLGDQDVQANWYLTWHIACANVQSRIEETEEKDEEEWEQLELPFGDASF